MSEVAERLLEEAERVHHECFPGSRESVELKEALQFLLGLPEDEIDILIDRMARIVEQRMHRTHVHPGPSQLYYHTIFTGIQLGIAAERLLKLDVP